MIPTAQYLQPHYKGKKQNHNQKREQDLKQEKKVKENDESDKWYKGKGKETQKEKEKPCTAIHAWKLESFANARSTHPKTKPTFARMAVFFGPYRSTIRPVGTCYTATRQT
jgi:hypothetical protein